MAGFCEIKFRNLQTDRDSDSYYVIAQTSAQWGPDGDWNLNTTAVQILTFNQECKHEVNKLAHDHRTDEQTMFLKVGITSLSTL